MQNLQTHCWILCSLDSSAQKKAAGRARQKIFFYKPLKPRSMKKLFTSSLKWKRNGLAMFSRLRLPNFLWDFLPFVLFSLSCRQKTFDSTINEALIVLKNSSQPRGNEKILITLICFLEWKSLNTNEKWMKI